MRISDWSSDVCSSDLCKGTGSEDGKLDTCDTCHGRGQVRFQRGIFSMQQPCPQCHGRGQTFSSPCPECRGAGRVEEEKVLSVKVPAGVDSGDRIRLTGQGAAGTPGSPPGDPRSDERPVGKEGVDAGRSRWRPAAYKKTTKKSY